MATCEICALVCLATTKLFLQTGAFEKRFGTGSFCVFMTCGFSKEECEKMNQYLIETDPAQKEQLAKEILIARPHDVKALSRRIQVARKFRSESPTSQSR